MRRLLRIRPSRCPVALFGTVLLCSLVGPDLGRAQDQFGSAVAAADDVEVMVLKALPGRGSAAVYVYRWEGGGFTLLERLFPVGTEQTGEGFSPSMQVLGGVLRVGSADPGPRWAAQTFVRADDGWGPGERIPLDPSAASPGAPGSLDFAGIMRILEPPVRTLAVDGNRVLVASSDGSTATVRVYETDGSDSWRIAGELSVPELPTGSGYGASLALRGDLALVGAPGHEGSGSVFVFGLDGSSGGWALSTVLRPEEGALAARFGSAIALDADRLLIGAPGNDSIPGSVTAFLPDGSRLLGHIESPDGPGDGFGAALALGASELWVGAPSALAGGGRIHRYDLGGPGGGAPTATGTVDGPAAGAPGAFGARIAVGETVAAVGVPTADFGVGRAALFARGPDGDWSEPHWVAPGGELTAVTDGEVACGDGQAAQFECDNVDLLAFLPITHLGGGPSEYVSDVWGWTDPETGREYALLGRTGGAAIVDITNPSSPIYVGVVEANPSGARDLKTYADHLFFTGDGAGDHGLVVFDLTRLRVVEELGTTFQPDAVYHGIASAHNLVVDPEAGFAYPVGASGGGETCGGGLHMVDIREPTAPVFAGCYTDTEGLIYAGRTHDAQCTIYHGPDEAFQGRQICFASNETALRIVDVTEKETPVPLAAATYPGLAYVHQGWLTDDHRYYYMDDELDELVGKAERTRTLVWDVMELEDPVFVGEFFGSTGATDHNLYIKGNRMYQANYTAGLEVWDISAPEQPVQIGSFDTTPWEGDPPGFHGAWTAYPFFDSGTVLVSSIGEGLFILRPRVIHP